MWTGWLILLCGIGAVAAIVVWLLIVAVVVTQVETRHHEHLEHSGRHAGGR